MTCTRHLQPTLRAALVALAALVTPGAHASDFASTRPAPRVEYWQKRQAMIDAQLADATKLRAVKLVFVGDSITDFWLLGDNPWIPGRPHGRAVWDDAFGGRVAQNLALNIGISGDRTEHLLHRILPRSQGGLGHLDARELAPEFFVLMVGINNAYAAESPVADSDDTVVRPVNARLATLACRPEFAGFTTWVDLYPAFVDTQGRQDTRLFVDGLHPSEAGYRVWRDRLLPALEAARAQAR